MLGHVIITYNTCSYLARVVKTFPNETIDKYPGHNKTDKQVPLDLSHLLNTTTDMQNLIATKYLRHLTSVVCVTVSYLQNCSTAVSLSASLMLCMAATDSGKGIPLSGVQQATVAQVPSRENTS